jgi:DNA-binding IclR family transcriptional regulator
MQQRATGQTPARRRQGAATTNGRTYALQVLDRVCDVLDYLAARPATLTEISTHLALNRSTVFRILVNLERRGLVQRDEPSGAYRLGIQLFEWGAQALQGQLSIERLRPLLDELAAETEYTAQLWVRAGLEALCVDQVESPRDYRVVGRIGRRMALHVGAVGKVLLAFAPPRIQERVLAGPLVDALGRATERTALQAELARIRHEGCAVYTGEHRLISWAVAAPVVNALGAADAAVVVVAGAAEDEPPAPSLAQVRAAVIRTAARMSQRLHFPDAPSG